MVRNSVFRNNVVQTDAEEGGKVIWFGDNLVFDQNATTNPSGSIENSCFFDNYVNNTILIYDDVAEVGLSNNFGERTTVIDENDGIICSDIALATVAAGRALEFSCVDFDADHCDLMAPHDDGMEDEGNDDATLTTPTVAPSGGTHLSLVTVGVLTVTAMLLVLPDFVV